MTRLARKLWCRTTGWQTRAPGFASGGLSLLRRALGVTAIVLVAAVVGCSGNPAVNTGPFGGGGNWGQNCVPIRHAGELVTDGFNEVTDGWRGTVAVITKIGLVRPRGLRLLRAYAMRLNNHALYGTIPGLPPYEDGLTSYPWKGHVNAIGARVPYTKNTNVDTNLLLVIKTTARKSTYQGINVWYRVGTRQYHMRTSWGSELLARPARC